MGLELSYEVEGQSFRGYLASGARGASAPGILVLPEALGLGAHAMARADQLAELGYVAYAIDLFGEPVTSTEQAFGFVRQLTDDYATLRARALAGLAQLAAQAGVDGDRLAAIGFCFGGQSAIELARTGVDLKAAVGFHSGLTTLRPEDSQNIKAKVLVLLGNEDPLVPTEARTAFMTQMAEAGVDAQMLLMSGAVHSFTNRDATAFGVPGVAYDARADRRAWAAMLALFNEAFAA